MTKLAGSGCVVAAVVWVAMGAQGQAPVEKAGGRIDLPSSKQIAGVVPGGPQRLNSLPVTMAMSPDGRWVVTVNGGYGSFESRYMQSVAVMDTRTGTVVDFPDERTGVDSKQVLFSGLAFSGDGKRVYGSIVSLTDPLGTKGDDTGTGVQVYGFAEGKLTRERVIRIAPQKLAAGRRTLLAGGGEAGAVKGDGTRGMPYPAAIAVLNNLIVPGVEGLKRIVPERLLVANNLSDEVLIINSLNGQVVLRFDLSESDVVPSTYPVALAVSRDGTRGYVALWNASEVVELDLVKGTVGRKLALLKGDDPVKPGSHPDALAMSPDGRTLYAALGNRDAVAALDLSEGGFKLKGYFDARLPGQSFYGAQPEALAVSADGGRLYVADMGVDAVAVVDTRRMTKGAVEKGFVEAAGFVPTEWLPMGVAVAGGKLYVTTGKGTGTGPNNVAQRATEETKGNARFLRTFSYIPTLLHGSVAVVDEKTVERELKALTGEALEDNRMRVAAERIEWNPAVLARLPGGPTHPTPTGKDRPSGTPDRDEAAMNGARGGAAGATARTRATADSSASLRNDKQGGLGNDERLGVGAVMPRGAGSGPIKHVIYIIRENRTYDQVLGDLKLNGKAVGNGDASLTMYGEAVTPNLHKLALQFGVLDNFYDSAEVSGDGHVWSNTAIGTDYLERTWQLNYRGKEHGYDFEGVVSEGLPLEQGIADVNEPESGYLWGNLAKHGMTLYHFGEFISSTFCTNKGKSSAQQDSREGPMREGSACSQRNEVKPGERLPEVWGGGVNKWPWAIPLIATNRATKPELVGHFATEAPDFNLRIPDQVRVDVFLRHLEGWVADRNAGKDTMPNFVMLRLANDHTGGTVVGGPTPKSSVADNDLAVGRAVEAISHSAFWDDTAFFILEDDAQNGADHVDAHRSLGVVVSKYAPRGEGGGAFVDSRFYSTVSMVRTMETVLGLPPMNNNDALASMMGSLFTGAGDQAAFAADTSNRENGLIYEANKRTAPGAAASAKMDFRHADRADTMKLNVILWQDAMGVKPVPAMLTEKRRKKKDADDE